MFSTNEQFYKDLYESKVVSSTITGKITISDTEEITLTDANIITGSLQINNKCVNGDDFEWGAVYQGELSVTLLLDVDRYKLYDKQITFTVHHKLTDGTTQDIPLGVYTISDPQWSKKLLTIKAVDGMEKLDIEVSESMNGSLYDLLSAAATACGVELAQTDEDLKKLTNGGSHFTCDTSNISTYRDLLAYLAKCTCSFATINRDGKVELRPYGTETARTIPTSRQKDATISDYQTYFVGVKAQFPNGDKYETFVSMKEGEETGLILDLGEIPVLLGTDETKQTALDAIWAVLEQIKYTPVSFDLLIADASLELGDMLTLDGSNVVSYITSYTWSYHGTMKITGVGGNPKLAKLKNKNSIDASTLANEIASKDIAIYTYTNASKYSINSEAKVVIKISYVTTENTTPIFIATIPLEMAADGVVHFAYEKDDVPIENADLYKYLPKGKHFVTLLYYLTEKANKFTTLEVLANTEYFESADRVQAADIKALQDFASTGTLPASVIDTTIPSMTIEKMQIKAIIFGQGLVSNSKEWDGRLTFTEVVTGLEVKDILPTITDAMKVETQVPTGSTFTETVPRLQVTLGFGNLTEEISFGVKIKSYTGTTASAYEFDSDGVTTAEGRWAMLKTRTRTSTLEEVDSGSMCSVSVDLTPYEIIEEVVITDG